MIEYLFTTLSSAVEGGPAIALSAAFAWGVLSILLSPCHLSSIPLIVGFIDEQGRISTKRAFSIALSFSLGLMISIGVIGLITALAGRMMGDVGKYGNYFVAGIFFLVGLHLFDLIPMPWSGPGNIGLKTERDFSGIYPWIHLRRCPRPLHFCLHGPYLEHYISAFCIADVVWCPPPLSICRRPLFCYCSCGHLYGSGPTISELERTIKRTAHNKKGMWRSGHTGWVLFAVYCSLSCALCNFYKKCYRVYMNMNGEKRLAVTFFVTLLILTGEIVGGYLSNSLALLSDAGHMVTDALAIALGICGCAYQ